MSRQDAARKLAALVGGAQAARDAAQEAVVTRVDEYGTAHASVAGGEEFPLAQGVAVAEGQSVPVEWRNGTYVATGNYSDPPDNSLAREVGRAAGESIAAMGEEVARVEREAAAADASIAAEVARVEREAKDADDLIAASVGRVEEAAVAARETAEGVEAIAVEAKETADGIAETAGRAAGDAESARASAEGALASARAASFGLADVEKVVESFTWIEEHGHYLLTTDEAVDPSATYYKLSGGLYRPTGDAAPDPYTQYYSRAVAYEPTEDEEVDPGKAYYAESGGSYSEVAEPDAAGLAGYYERVDAYEPIPADDMAAADMAACYEREGFAREAVAEPDAADLGSYFVLVVDESVRNYLASHLALTERGLDLVGNPDGYRATLTTAGLEVRDPDNRLVGLHGRTVQLGSADGIYFEASETRLSFRTSDQDIAYFGLSADGIWEMHISASYVDDMMRFGGYAFIRRRNGNLSLKWIGD